MYLCTRLTGMSLQVLLVIFSYLDARDLCRCAAVCVHWGQIYRDSGLWRHLLKQNFKEDSNNVEDAKHAYRYHSLVARNWKHCRYRALSLENHTKFVYFSQFHGPYLYTCSGDRTLKQYRTREEGRCTNRLIGHMGHVSTFRCNSSCLGISVYFFSNRPQSPAPRMRVSWWDYRVIDSLLCTDLE